MQPTIPFGEKIAGLQTYIYNASNLIVPLQTLLLKKSFLACRPQATFQNILCIRLLLHLRVVNDQAEPTIETISMLQVDVGSATVSAA